MLDYKFQLMLRKALMAKSCNRRDGAEACLTPCLGHFEFSVRGSSGVIFRVPSRYHSIA
jgi:hypothetical protein